MFLDDLEAKSLKQELAYETQDLKDDAINSSDEIRDIIDVIKQPLGEEYQIDFSKLESHYIHTH